MKLKRDDILQVEDIGISFGGLKAVDQMSFQISGKGVTTIIGPNGAGKSTCFNMITGHHAPKSGTVRFAGTDVTGWPSYQIARLGLSRSYQITNLFDGLNVLENLLIGRYHNIGMKDLLKTRDLDDPFIDEVVELLETFGMADLLSRDAGVLSHGERRRMEIALCLMTSPQMIMLDEPTQGMSYGDTLETSHLIRQLGKKIPVLMIEHDVDLVMDISKHIIVMHQGRKLFEGPPKLVRQNEEVKHAYLGES